MEASAGCDVLFYVVDRCRQAGLAHQEIISLVRNLVDSFEVESEYEAVDIAEKYLREIALDKTMVLMISQD